MVNSAQTRLAAFLDSASTRSLASRRLGLEKESLRTAADGVIATTPHPRALGSALTHPWITTDYSEALLEFVTPPCHDVRSALVWLDELQRFTYAGIGDELLWAASMPCVVAGEDSIPIAEYGTSNAGLMRHIYRRGLGYRYGRVMQVIAGVHLNFSLGEPFWLAMQQHLGSSESLQAFRSRHYMGLIRNQQRLGWVVPYLFGCSPAVCNSFLRGKSADLPAWDDNTSYGPYATSLRMSDLGYQNKRRAGLRVSYDSLEAYTASLEHAVRTPWPEYEKIGVMVDGEYRQLNANILQIENEYYSSMRPKPPADTDLPPGAALRHHGIEYVELRSLDMNVFDPRGVSEEPIRFLEAFLLYCLFLDSPPIDTREAEEIDHNQHQTTCRGRDPDLHLLRHGHEVPLREWLTEILQAMKPFCAALDTEQSEPVYGPALESMQQRAAHPQETPSARMLAQMAEHEQGFFNFAIGISRHYREQYLARPLDTARQRELEQIAARSLIEQRDLEKQPQQDFARYLAQRAAGAA